MEHTHCFNNKNNNNNNEGGRYYYDLSLNDDSEAEYEGYFIIVSTFVQIYNPKAI